MHASRCVMDRCDASRGDPALPHSAGPCDGWAWRGGASSRMGRTTKRALHCGDRRRRSPQRHAARPVAGHCAGGKRPAGPAAAGPAALALGDQRRWCGDVFRQQGRCRRLDPASVAAGVPPGGCRLHANQPAIPSRRLRLAGRCFRSGGQRRIRRPLSEPAARRTWPTAIASASPPSPTVAFRLPAWACRCICGPSRRALCAFRWRAAASCASTWAANPPPAPGVACPRARSRRCSARIWRPAHAPPAAAPARPMPLSRLAMTDELG
jgi:hypothetical protein